jgi:hypothetical protein
VCEGTILSCTGGACSRGYKRGKRGREAPKSLLEEVIEASAKIVAQESGCVCSVSYVCVNDDIVQKMVPASPFYRHKEGRSTCTWRSKVVVFSPNQGRAVGDYCRKYTVGH